jgi:hypothetical protein
MGRNPFAEKRIAARRLIVYQGADDEVAQVYAVRRIRSEDLQEHGFAEILGPDALASAQAAAQRQRDHEHLMASATTEAGRFRLAAELEAMTAERNREVLGAIDADETRKRHLLARCEAYLLAAVWAVGIALDTAEPGVQPLGTTPESVCRNIAEGEPVPMYLRPGRLVRGPDAKEDEIPLSEIPAIERIALGLLVMTALEVASVVATFPRGPGSPRAR